jgi:hypothetical protein
MTATYHYLKSLRDLRSTTRDYYASEVPILRIHKKLCRSTSLRSDSRSFMKELYAKSRGSLLMLLTHYRSVIYKVSFIGA